MKRQIRRNVFETNSSSMHSLVIKKESCYYNDKELRTGIWSLDRGVIDTYSEDDLTFGRTPFRCLSTFFEKVKYSIASLCGYRNNANEIFKTIENIVKEVIPECKEIILPLVYHYDLDYEGEDELSYGHVDEDILTPFLEKYEIPLKEFLTNKKYVVIVDGDEYCIWEEMKESGLVNEEEIEEEY